MKRKNPFIYALLIGCILLTGCESNNDTAPSGNDTVISDSHESTSLENESQNTTEQADASIITGMIESIDTSSITIAAFRKPDNEPPKDDAPQNNSPQDNSPQGDVPQDTPPQNDAPQDTLPQGDAPQDTPPQGDAPQGTPPEMPSASETTTITITDSTVITDESGNEITLDSLNAGSMVTVETDESGAALTIQFSGNAPSQEDSDTAQDAPASYNSEA